MVGLQLSLPEGSKEGETAGLDDASDIFRLPPKTRLALAWGPEAGFDAMAAEAGDDDGSVSFFQKVLGRTAFVG